MSESRHPHRSPKTAKNIRPARARLDERREWLATTIARHGWAWQAIGYGFCSEPGCRACPAPNPWSYTVGLYDFGQPELVILGGGLDDNHGLLHHIVDLRRGGLIVKEETEFCFAGMKVRVADVPDAWLLTDRNRMASWYVHYGCEPGLLPPVQQLITHWNTWVLADDPYPIPRA